MSTPLFRVLVSSLLSAGLLIGFGSSAVAQDKAPKEKSAEQKVETLKLDPVHSNMIFRVKHMDSGLFFGEFFGDSGEIKYDPKNPENSTFSVEVMTDSVSTGNAKRDTHLKSADFFDVKQFPKMTFKSTSVKKRGENTLEVTGDLSIHGKTQKVTTIVQMTGSSTDPKGNFHRGFYTTLNINRSDFGMDFMLEGGVSDNVKLILSIEGIQAAK